VVFPRVEEDEGGDLKAVTRELGPLRAALAPHAVSMLHGRLAAEEKDRVMSAFRSGEVKVLVATSVIEVGVDVPNATVMVIENAEQFGLAQPHQRGRIGGAPTRAIVSWYGEGDPGVRARLLGSRENQTVVIAEATASARRGRTARPAQSDAAVAVCRLWALRAPERAIRGVGCATPRWLG
jgi:hypothetical protein